MIDIGRRKFSAMAGLAALAVIVPGSALTEGTAHMYGLISKLNVAPGQRDKLATILLAGTKDMPGCLGYVVARDAADANAVWVTEVWESAERHRASLSLPQVQRAMAEGKPLITGFGQRIETIPVGGVGLPSAR